MRSLLYTGGAIFAMLFVLGLFVPDPPAREEVQAPPPTSTPTSAATKAPSTPTPAPSTATPVARVLTAQEACHAAQRLVSAQLRAPSTAKFLGNCGSGRDLTITRGETPDGLTAWTVSGQVDSQNAFGAMIRSTYQATVTDLGPVPGGYVTGGQVDWIR